MEPFFYSIFKTYYIIYVPSWTCEFTFHSALSMVNPLPVSNLIHQLCVLTDHLILIYMPQLWSCGPLAGTANQLLVCWWHCQWKRLVCKAQTTSTTLLNKKALVKAFGSDAILMGVTCKYATAVTWWPSSCFVLCTHVRQKCVHARAPVPRHEEQTCSCLYDLSL